jgi:cobyrinic acid a,c-diamide synthase
MLKTIFDGAENDEFPGILIAGTHSRAGKTTIARLKSALASYVHLHFLSCPGFADKFVGAR